MVDVLFFFSSRRRHTRYWRDWSSDVCSSDLEEYPDDCSGREEEQEVGQEREVRDDHTGPDEPELFGVDARTFEGALARVLRSEEHTSELQSRQYLVCRLLLEKKKLQFQTSALHSLTE